MSGSAGVFDRVYTEKGLRVMLPVVNNSAITLAATTGYASDALACAALNSASPNRLYTGTVTYNKTTEGGGNSSLGTDGSATDCEKYVVLQLTESLATTDARGTGTGFTVNLGVDGGTTSSPKTQVSTHSVTTKRIQDTDNYVGYVSSDYATKVYYATGGDQDSLDITYHGDEVYGNVFLASSGAVSQTGSATVPIIKDNAAMPTDRNLIVVGGSCVNSLAAKIQGVPTGTCGTASGIAQDKYIVKVVAASSVVDGAETGKIAVLVAGWEAADTVKAANKLLETTTSTNVGTLITGPATGA
jgi:hypothetical protein